MPHLRGPHFDVLLRTLFFLHLCGLESNLSAYTEVSDYVEDDFLEHCIFGEFLEDVRL